MPRSQPPKPAKMPSSEALFRFQVVSEVLSRVLRGELRPQAVAAVAGLAFATGEDRPRKVSVRTIYRWLAAFGERELQQLEPTSRQRTQTSVVLSQALLDFVAAEKQRDIHASLPEILLRARLTGVIGEHERIDRSSLWRACVRMGVPVLRRKKAKVRDSHRFAYPHRMDLILCDGKYFRAGVKRTKRLAMFFLDDATRLGLHVVVGPSEGKALFLRGLYETIQHWGIAGIVYLDHGPGFIAEDTLAVIARLPSLLIHGEVKYPEGHGKIEKFNQTALNAVLRNYSGRPDIDPDCGALELRLRHWLRETYNHTPHEELGHNITPWQRFSTDQRPLRLPESLAALRERFVLELRRRVSNDHVVSVDGVDYETPRGLGGTKVTLWRQVLDDTLWVLAPNGSGHLVRLAPVDLVANAQARRAKAPPEPETLDVPPMSAADMAFARDFHPVVGADGGFADSTPKENPTK